MGDPRMGDISPDQLTNTMRNGFPDSPSETESPNHTEADDRTGNKAENPYQSARRRDRRPSSSSYYSLPSENVSHRHHRRSNAVAIPVSQLLSPSRPALMRSKSGSPLKLRRACEDGCDERRQALEDSANRVPLSADGIETPSRSYRSHKPSKPDAHPFYHKASQNFCAETYRNDMAFEPRICSYMLLQHASVSLLCIRTRGIITET